MEEDEESADVGAQGTVPLLWTRKLTSRLLNEYRRHGPEVGTTIRSMVLLHTLIAKNMKNDCKIEITPCQIGNKLKSLKRKYQQCLEKGVPLVEIAPGIEEAMKLMDRLTYKFSTPKVKKSSFDHQNDAAVQSIKTPNGETYSLEIVDEGLQNEGDMMDVHEFLSKKANTSKIAMDTTYQDPLERDVVTYDHNYRGVDKLDLLEKKLEKQEKSLEEKHKKNELIEERNRLIATLMTKKTKNDVIDAIRKDRLLHHQEMKDLWAERLEVEKKKLHEKKRKNDLLEERNKLMKALIKEMNMKRGGDVSSDNKGDFTKKSGDDIGSEDEDVSPAKVNQAVELE